MITVSEDGKWFKVLLGFKDVGVGICISGPEDDPPNAFYGIVFTQLSRPYEKDEAIPESEREGAKIVLEILDEAGYALLLKTVKQIGSEKGFDKYVLGDKLFENLMTDLGHAHQDVRRLEYELKQLKENTSAETPPVAAT
jgi:hypothetical protein